MNLYCYEPSWLPDSGVRSAMGTDVIGIISDSYLPNIAGKLLVVWKVRWNSRAAQFLINSSWSLLLTLWGFVRFKLNTSKFTVHDRSTKLQLHISLNSIEVFQLGIRPNPNSSWAWKYSFDSIWGLLFSLLLFFWIFHGEFSEKYPNLLFTLDGVSIFYVRIE